VEALSRPDLSRHQCQSQNLEDLGTRYLLGEYIEEAHGGMVSCTRNEKNRHKKKLRSKLFRSPSPESCWHSLVSLYHWLAHSPSIMDGSLSLRNRSLPLRYKILNTSRFRSTYARNFTYSAVGSYVVDIFAFHDSPLHNQPNAVMYAEDGLCQPNCGPDGHEDDILLFLPENRCDEGHFVISSHPISTQAISLSTTTTGTLNV
jgi:hypothetical protein